MTALLIAGTDTDVGKTFVTIALAAYWQEYHAQERLGIFKPIQTGTGDAEQYHSLFSQTEAVEVVVPQRFTAPVAPPIAAAKEGKRIDLGKIWQQYNTLRQKSEFTLIESLGGLGSPVTDELIVGNLAADWRLPILLVVPVKLGAIAHTVANVALARSLKIDLRGIILNCCQPVTKEQIEDLTPINLIQNLTQISVIGTLPYLEDIANSSQIARTVANWDLELILPQPQYSK